MKRVVIFLAPGFEEIEAVTPIDVLRRAEVEVIVAGLKPGPITGSHGITVLPDTTLDTVRPEDVDMVVLPGGLPGSAHLREDARVLDFLQRMDKAGKYTCAICAAPSVLHAAGVIGNRAITSHPAVKQDLPQDSYREDRVVVDGSLVTSRGPGTALEFSLELVGLLKGPEMAETHAAIMLARR